LLARAIADLPERQGLVLQLYFVEQLSLDDIGTVLEVGAARVCQIKKAALDRLREVMLVDSQPGEDSR
jgi:RNA polymerase sigma factor for flagellar operon FliA